MARKSKKKTTKKAPARKKVSAKKVGPSKKAGSKAKEDPLKFKLEESEADTILRHAADMQMANANLSIIDANMKKMQMQAKELVAARDELSNKSVEFLKGLSEKYGYGDKAMNFDPETKELIEFVAKDQ